MIIFTHIYSFQFHLCSASVKQRTLYKVNETYTLDTRLRYVHLSDLTIHSHALPFVMVWPSVKYYTYKGKSLDSPDCWNGSESLLDSDDENYGVCTPASIIPIMPSKRCKR